MASTVRVVVNGLAGPCCTLDGSAEWTILQVHEALHEKIGVPVDWQTLLKDTEKLAWEVTVVSLMSDKTVQLTLLIEEVPELEPWELLRAITLKDEAAVLQLLRRHQLPGLNDIDADGRTALHDALAHGLPAAALAIATRPEFLGINAQDEYGCTALHYAAQGGFLPVCRAILNRPDFTELLAVDGLGETALKGASNRGHQDVMDLLGEAEAQPL